MDESENNLNQENNQTLLNAIRNKFAAQNATESKSSIPSMFTIPTLKMGVFGETVQPDASSPSTSTLNKFIKLQLNEKHSNGEIGTTEFDIANLPKLHLGSKKLPQNCTNNFVIPQLKTANINRASVRNDAPLNINNLSKAINDLKVSDDVMAEALKSNEIDLTAALSCSLKASQNTALIRSEHNKIAAFDKNCDFNIPFIECDRVERRTSLPPSALNDYCETYVSGFGRDDISDSFQNVKHLLAEPSAIGRFMELNHKCIKTKQRIKDVPVKTKYKITPFAFDTKSPDDLVLESLNKYQRQHVN